MIFDKIEAIPYLCRKIIILKSIETIIYSTFFTGFIVELYKHITITEFAFSDIYYAVLGLLLSSMIFTYKEKILNYFKIFLMLDIIVTAVLGFEFYISHDWGFYWLAACTIAPSIIQKFIDIGITRIEYNACPDDRLKEDVNLLTDITRNVSIIIGGSICILLSSLNIFNISVWILMITIAQIFSSLFYFNIDSKFLKG